MIRADKAVQIMQRYEDDYDNFLDKLKAKRNAKKQQATQARAVAERADVAVRKAEARKPAVLKERAKNLLDKAGGIEGATDTAKNVIKYFKTDTPSDYSVGFGGSGNTPPADDSGFMKQFGIGAALVIGGGTLVTLAFFYGLYRLLKKPSPTVIQTTSPVTSGNQVVQTHN